jgi:hypothetical protein
MALRRSKKPTGLEIRAYNVGFGDCFLLSFQYADGAKHVLIDFGSKPGPEGAPKNHMVAVAKAIAKQCAGRLDAVVATHRHADHISGFTHTKRGDSGDIIRQCATNAVIIQPWTEHPRVATNAKREFGKGAVAFAGQMDAMHSVAETIVRLSAVMDNDEIDADTVDPAALAASGGPKTRGTRPKREEELAKETFRQRIRYMGEDNVKNKPAVDNLMTMSKPAKRRYVYFGSDAGLETVLPGVKVRVLGPPTAEQWPAVQTQKKRDPDEYWHLQQQFWQKMSSDAASPTGNGGRLFARRYIAAKEPAESEWFVRRLRGVHAKNLLHSLVMIDKAMNNTSVILLFEVGNRKLLFPGDAQIENWEYCLKHARNRKAIRKLLAGVDVYKVGHHGSLNATPKTLYNEFAKRARDGNRMTTLISTMQGIHGESKETAVPRSTLVAALKRDTNYRTTEKVKLSELCFVEKVELG